MYGFLELRSTHQVELNAFVLLLVSVTLELLLCCKSVIGLWNKLGEQFISLDYE